MKAYRPGRIGGDELDRESLIEERQAQRGPMVEVYARRVKRGLPLFDASESVGSSSLGQDAGGRAPSRSCVCSTTE